MRKSIVWLFVAILGTSSLFAQDTPKKTSFKIDANTYRPIELTIKESGMTMKMKIQQIRFGVPDETFAFSPAKYPDAVVIKR